MKVTPKEVTGSLQTLDTKKTNGLDSLAQAKSKNPLSNSSEINGGEKVALSENARLMQKAKDIALRAPDVDEAKVARLQKMIDEGKYNVDAKAIADKLVDDHLLFES